MARSAIPCSAALRAANRRFQSTAPRGLETRRRDPPVIDRRYRGQLPGRSLDPGSNAGTRGMIATPIASGHRIRLTGLLAFVRVFSII